MYKRTHASIKVESRSTSLLMSTIYILPLSYLRDLNLLVLTCTATKRVSGNQPLSTVSKYLLLGLPLKIYVEQNKYRYINIAPVV